MILIPQYLWAKAAKLMRYQQDFIGILSSLVARKYRAFKLLQVKFWILFQKKSWLTCGYSSIQNPKSKIPNPKSKIQNPKIPNLKSQIPNLKSKL